MTFNGRGLSFVAAQLGGGSESCSEFDEERARYKCDLEVNQTENGGSDLRGEVRIGVHADHV